MKNTFLLIISVLFSVVLLGQTYTGTIYTADDKLPAPFTTIFIEQSGLGTVADKNGKFSLEIPKALHDKFISISFIGYRKQDIPIASLKVNRENVFYMEEEVTGLQEVVLTTKRKGYTGLQLLKKSLKHIEENYSTDTTSFDGYYRETVTENGKYIKYADAICEFNYAPYRKKRFKRREYFNDWRSISLSDISQHWGERFHRGHYPYKTLEDDQLHIIASRSSDNLSTKGQEANIEGGPLGLLGKDRVKFRKLFTRKSDFSKYEYKLSEKLDSTTNELNYVVSFTPIKFASDTLPKKFSLRFKFYSNNVGGYMTIDRKTFAIKHIEYSVPKQFRNHICNYKSMNLKHLDYRVKSDYKFIDGKYYLSYMKLEDEFVYIDTVTNTRTAYNSTSELKVYNVKPNKKKNFNSDDLFINSDANQVYDYAVDYDSLTWNAFAKAYSEYNIPQNIRTQMENKKPLEKQFVDKHIRDLSFPEPIAKEKPYAYKMHGQTIEDNYAWLKDVKDPKHNNEVMTYIREENAYFTNYFTPLRKHQRNLFQELKKYTLKNKTSLPVKMNGYYYYSKYIEDNQYPIYYRKKEHTEHEEELLNVEKLAKGKMYYVASISGISPNNTIMAYAENTTGKDKSILKFRNLETGVLLKDSLEHSGEMIWLNNSTFLYTVQDPITYRSYEVRAHTLLTPYTADKVIYTEPDLTYDVSIYKSKSKEFVFITTGSSTTTEQYYIRTNTTNLTLKCLYKREEGHRYGVSHIKDKFYILTNKKAINKRLVKVDTATYEMKYWEDVLSHQDDVVLTSFIVFKDYLAYTEKENAQARLMVLDFNTEKTHKIKIKEDFYSINFSSNPDFDSDTLQYTYTSFKTPAHVIRYHMETKEQRTIKKERLAHPYLGRLKTKRVWATAKDGTEIPITLFYDPYKYYKKGWNKKVLLTAYGSYGMSQEPGFTTALLPLVQRGFLYAVAHIRGGGDLGQEWYNQGKMLNKKNTFTDFIDCAEYLIEEEYTKKGEITIEGGSAGGLLMGAVSNMRPDLFKAVILNVPFVDVMNTMLDDKLPLTTGEYVEWGNPNKKTYFNYMMSYSPYDNVKAQNYPHMFFFTGLNDTRVGYWEPAKMVARLRKTKTDNNVLLLKTDINSGHGGNSGRYSYYKNVAMKYSILFELYRASSLLGKQ